MNHSRFNKIQYDFFARHLRADLGAVKVTQSCRWMVDTHRLGRIQDGWWFYTEQDRAAIIELVQQQLHIDLLFDHYPDKSTRVDNALSHNNEKFNALSVSNDFVLVNALQTLQLNGQEIEVGSISSLGLYIDASKINSVEHQFIVLVENLAVMANLKHLVFMDNAAHLKNALWLYRGDQKSIQSTHQAYAFFRSFTASHQLLCFADVDPKGLEIALSSSATKVLTVQTRLLETFNISGIEKDFYNQIKSVNYLKSRTFSADFQSLFSTICEYKKTIKQEHILAHQIPVAVVELFN